jgi:hypothetical protein
MNKVKMEFKKKKSLGNVLEQVNDDPTFFLDKLQQKC